MTCHPGPDGGSRLTGPRHEGEHEQCDPCPERHCHLCGHAHLGIAHRQTCPECITTTRDNLDVIARLGRHSVLADQAAHRSSDGRPEADRLLGGDAMDLLGPVGDLRGWQAQLDAAEQRWIDDPEAAAEDRPDLDHALDAPDDDHAPPLLVLATWVDDWRAAFRHGAAGHRATLGTEVAYLGRHLHHAAQWHDAYGEFAADVARCRSQLETVLHAGERDDPTAAPCFDCGGQLVRKVDAGGREDAYTCRRCRRVYDVASYWLAVRAHAESEAG